MGRRLFLSHLAEVSLPIIPGIQGVHTPDEGIISCIYTYRQGSASCNVNISICASDVDEYPDGNSFMLYTEDESADPIISTTLHKVTDCAHGRTLPEILSETSRCITAAISHDKKEQEGTSDADLDDFDFDYDSDDADFGLGDIQTPSGTTHTHSSTATLPLSSGPLKNKARLLADLRAVKDAGFRVGIIGNLGDSGVLCISIRIVKLGLSDEAMQAWSLRRKHYLVLLIKYRGLYCEASGVREGLNFSNMMEMQVGLCEHYKPSVRDPSMAIHRPTMSAALEEDKPETMNEVSAPLEPVFIGKPLNQLLRERLFHIIKARDLHSLSWLGAEKYVQDKQTSTSMTARVHLKDYHCDDNMSARARALPELVKADHMAHVPLENASLPLIIMQFTLRHFVRCTEFCLVCHARVEDSFEALKPYVCSRPLCLYQYMALGFGPSLEWEVCSQPYVVDLLVSFCYAAARAGRMKELPIGMNLTVPILPQYGVPIPEYSRQLTSYPKPPPTPPPSAEKSFDGTWYADTRSLWIPEHESSMIQQVKAGDWLCTLTPLNRIAAHHRVNKVRLPYIELGQSIYVPFTDLNSGVSQAQSANANLPASAGMPCHCYVYDKSFDDLPKRYQQHAIVALLDTLPGIGEMCAYLKQQGRSCDGNLKLWHERLSESSLNLLRWIVASNRSCILQVDQPPGGNVHNTSSIMEDRVGRMDAYMQFRFAQGAPDKEQRFNDAVQSEAKATGTQYPTIFAWHGSRLGNWHSIVRQGLRFDEICNGRAYGNGVYMSTFAATSLGYSGGDNLSRSTGETSTSWKPSMLQISRAFSLNEVVNNPTKFVHTNPHYVVSNIDWIQTRYLFVKVANTFKFDHPGSTDVYTQDPERAALNEQNIPITIPMTAISKSRRPYTSVQIARTDSGKRSKTILGTDQATGERQEDDANSVVSDVVDLELLARGTVDDCEVALRDHGGLSSPLPASIEEASPQTKKRSAEGITTTDFVPGSLDVSNIKFLEPPRDATTASTQALMRLLKETLATQDKTSLETLGWYIDRNLINNMYQWIVELHSFPLTLPLGRDMQAAKVNSIVLEIRFPNQFPFSPPFIRVVKPRFLPFVQGGGGNVTEGGAMCMEVLTNNGWTAAQNIESLLLQVRMAICDEERPARLAGSTRGGVAQNTYAIGEAVNAYIRACRAHGWTIPADFDKLHQG
jgi:ubiquitin-conjugating enzyme E2 Q